MRSTVLVLLVAAPLVAADPKDTKAPLAREVKVEGLSLPPRKDGMRKPLKVDTAEELEKAIADPAERAKVAKAVDLKKEFLLIFAWAGSGGDRLSFEAEKGKDKPAVI